MGDQRVVPLPTDRPLVGAVRERALEPGRRRARRRPWRPPTARSSRRCSAGARAVVPAATSSSKKRGQLGRRSRSRSAASAGPAGRSRGSSTVRGSSGTASSRPAMAASRSASGAKSRANRRNSPSPIASIANERRSQMRRIVGVEDRPADVVELEVALEPGRRREVGRVDRLDRGQVRLVVLDVGEQRLAAAVAELVVGVVQAEPGRRGRARARPCGGSGPRPGRTGARRRVRRRARSRVGEAVGRRCGGVRSRWSSSAGAGRGGAPGCVAGGSGVRAARWRPGGGSGGGADGIGRDRPGIGLGQGRARRGDGRLDVVGGHAVVGHGADLSVRIFHHQHVPCSERGEERGAVARDLEQDEVRADAPGVERSGRRLGGAAGATRCRP